MKKLIILFGFVLIITCFSCGSSVLAIRNPGKSITKNIRKKAVTNDIKKYKKMKSCEEKYIRRFSKIYNKQQKQHDDYEISTPFFSSNFNNKKF